MILQMQVAFAKTNFEIQLGEDILAHKAVL